MKVRISLAAMALTALVAAGCGSSSRPHPASRPLPPHLARVWAAQATAIAAASAAGDSCGAYHLASHLRDIVIAAESQVPARLQGPLIAGVNALADRTTCPPPSPPPPQTEQPPKKHPPHEQHHHHHGDGGDQGSQS